jgi:hypothetical protein
LSSLCYPYCKLSIRRVMLACGAVAQDHDDPNAREHD